jgi:cell division protein FtsQ
VIIMGLAVVLAAAWWVSNSPVFDMKSLTVEGNGHLTDGDVARLSGLTSTSNVLWMSTGPIEERLERDPWVSQASVARHLPTGITIRITERVATAVTAGGQPMLVAGDGTVLGRAGASTELPLIAPPPGPITVGERLPVSAELTVVAALPDSLRQLVMTVTREADGSLALLMRDGTTVSYGDASQAEAKAVALRAVLSWAQRQRMHPTYIDVRAPSAPAIGTTPLVEASTPGT